VIQDRSGVSAATTRRRLFAVAFGAWGKDRVGNTQDDTALTASLDDVTPRLPRDAESLEGVSSMDLERADSHPWPPP